MNLTNKFQSFSPEVKKAFVLSLGLLVTLLAFLSIVVNKFGDIEVCPDITHYIDFQHEECGKIHHGYGLHSNNTFLGIYQCYSYKNCLNELKTAEYLYCVNNSNKRVYLFRDIGYMIFGVFFLSIFYVASVFYTAFLHLREK